MLGNAYTVSFSNGTKTGYSGSPQSQVRRGNSICNRRSKCGQFQDLSNSRSASGRRLRNKRIKLLPTLDLWPFGRYPGFLRFLLVTNTTFNVNLGGPWGLPVRAVESPPKWIQQRWNDPVADRSRPTDFSRESIRPRKATLQHLAPWPCRLASGEAVPHPTQSRRRLPLQDV